jgi:hypothetical protein
MRELAAAIHPELPDNTPLEASMVAPIDTQGAWDAHSDFPTFATEAVRTRVAEAATQLLQAAKPNGIDPDEVYVSCFVGNYDDDSLTAIDAEKLNAPAPFDSHYEEGGNDSNEANIHIRSINALRRELAVIGRELGTLHEAGTLTPSAKTAGMAEMADINSKIAAIKERQSAANLPVYYATPLEGLRNDIGEDNPLAYAGEFDERGPTVAHLALYDAAALRAAGIRIEEKSVEQLRIFGRGADIMQHCLAVMDVVYVNDTPYNQADTESFD